MGLLSFERTYCLAISVQKTVVSPIGLDISAQGQLTPNT
jgi:hypothetical protein